MESKAHIFNCPFSRVVFILPSLALGGAESNAVKMANLLVSSGIPAELWGILKDRSIVKKLDQRVKTVNIDAHRLLGGCVAIWRCSRRSVNTLFISNLWPVNLISYLALAFLDRSNQRLFVEHIYLKSGLQHAGKIEQAVAILFHHWAKLIKLRFVAVSDGVAEGLIRDFGLSVSQVRRIYNPVLNDMVQFKVRDLELSRSSILRILAVGHLKPQKDYATFIRALAELRGMGIRFESRIAGEGPERALIESMVERLGLHRDVILLGSVEEPMELYRWADVFVMTSRWEGLGNVIVEALSAGCRIVATDCLAGPREILSSGDFGRLVHVGDAPGIAEAIFYSLNDSLDELRLRAHLKLFNIKEVTQEYITFASEA